MSRPQSHRAQLLVDCRNALGEMPVWEACSGTLHWVDVIAPGRVYQLDLASMRVDFDEFVGLVTGIDLCASGGLLMRTGQSIVHVDRARGMETPIASLPDQHMRFNDGHCDANGRLWVGVMPNNIATDGSPVEIRDHTGYLMVVGDHEVRRIEAQMGCPNAISWSPDGNIFYVADSCDGWLYQYAFDQAAGVISNRRPFARFDDLGIPDGVAIDQEGYLWNARWGAGAVARISPAGKLEEVVQIPAIQPTACCFGGADLRTLFVTTARYGLSEAALAREPTAGGIFAIEIDVPGAPMPAFHLESSGSH